MKDYKKIREVVKKYIQESDILRVDPKQTSSKIIDIIGNIRRENNEVFREVLESELFEIIAEEIQKLKCNQIEEKIEKVQINVAETKVKYDKAVDELEKLLMKRKERDNKQLLKAFSESEKTLAEVIEFLQGNKSSED